MGHRSGWKWEAEEVGPQVLYCGAGMEVSKVKEVVENGTMRGEMEEGRAKRKGKQGGGRKGAVRVSEGIKRFEELRSTNR